LKAAIERRGLVLLSWQNGLPIGYITKQDAVALVESEQAYEVSRGRIRMSGRMEG